MPSDRPSEPAWLNETRVTLHSPRPRLAAPAGNDCVVIIYSRSAAQLGRRFLLEPRQVICSIGRGADNTIVLDSESASRRHAAFELRNGVWMVVDLGSTNGTYVNDEPVRERRLMRGDLVKVGDTIFKYLAGSDVEAAYHEEIYRMTIVDGLTGAYNKRYFLEYLEQEIARSQRYARAASLVMIDLDHFKQVNDTHGHLAGDYTLRELAQVSRALVGEAGTFSRYGGEEFALVLPETTLPAACAVADDLRLAIEEHEFVFEQARLPITASFGVAALSREVRTPEDFIRLADARLYEAKDLGRNRVAF